MLRGFSEKSTLVRLGGRLAWIARGVDSKPQLIGGATSISSSRVVVQGETHSLRRVSSIGPIYASRTYFTSVILRQDPPTKKDESKESGAEKASKHPSISKIQDIKEMAQYQTRGHSIINQREEQRNILDKRRKEAENLTHQEKLELIKSIEGNVNVFGEPDTRSKKILRDPEPLFQDKMTITPTGSRDSSEWHQLKPQSHFEFPDENLSEMFPPPENNRQTFESLTANPKFGHTESEWKQNVSPKKSDRWTDPNMKSAVKVETAAEEFRKLSQENREKHMNEMGELGDLNEDWDSNYENNSKKYSAEIASTSKRISTEEAKVDDREDYESKKMEKWIQEGNDMSSIQPSRDTQQAEEKDDGNNTPNFKIYQHPSTGTQLFRFLNDPKGLNLQPLNLIKAIRDQPNKIVVGNRPVGFGRHAFLSLLENYHDIMKKNKAFHFFENSINRSIESIYPSHSNLVFNIYLSSLQLDSEFFDREFWGTIVEACRAFLARYRDYLPIESRKIDVYSSRGPQVLDQVLTVAAKGTYPAIVIIDDYNLPLHRNLSNISKIMFTYQHGNPSNSHVFKAYEKDCSNVDKEYVKFMEVLHKHASSNGIEKIIMGGVYPVDVDTKHLPKDDDALPTSPSQRIEKSSLPISFLSDDERFNKSIAIKEKEVKNALKYFVPKEKRDEAFALLTKYAGGFKLGLKGADHQYNIAQVCNFLEVAGKRNALPSEEDLQSMMVVYPFIPDIIVRSSLGCEILLQICLARDEGLEPEEPLFEILPFTFQDILASTAYSPIFILSLLFHSGLITYADDSQKRVRITNMNAAWRLVDAMLSRLSWDSFNTFKDMKKSLLMMLVNDDTSGVEEFFFSSQPKEYGYSRWHNVEVTDNTEQLLSLFLLFHLNGVFPTFDAHRNFSKKEGCADMVFFIPEFKTFIEYKNVYPYEVELPSGHSYDFCKYDFSKRGGWDDGIAVSKEIAEMSRNDFLDLNFKKSPENQYHESFRTIRDMKRQLNEEALQHLEEHLDVTGEPAKAFVVFQCGNRFKIKKVQKNVYPLTDSIEDINDIYRIASDMGVYSEQSVYPFKGDSRGGGDVPASKEEQL